MARNPSGEPTACVPLQQLRMHLSDSESTSETAWAQCDTLRVLFRGITGTQHVEKRGDLSCSLHFILQIDNLRPTNNLHGYVVAVAVVICLVSQTRGTTHGSRERTNFRLNDSYLQAVPDLLK